MSLALRLAGRAEEAAPAALEAMECVRPLAMQHNLAFALVELGHASLDRGDPDAARAPLLEALDVARRVSNPRMQGWAHLGLARLAHAEGEADLASAEAEAALGCFAGREFPWAIRMAEELRAGRAAGGAQERLVAASASEKKSPA